MASWAHAHARAPHARAEAAFRRRGFWYLLRPAFEEAAAAADKKRVAREDSAGGVGRAVITHEVRDVPIGVGGCVHTCHRKVADAQFVTISHTPRQRLNVLTGDDLDIRHQPLHVGVAARVIKVVVCRQDHLEGQASRGSSLRGSARISRVDNCSLLGGLVDDQVHVVVAQRLERRDGERLRDAAGDVWHATTAGKCREP